MPRWRVLILLAFAALLAACAAPPQPATSTYTLLPTATRTALSSATPTPLPPSETAPPITYTPRPTSTLRPTVTPTPSLPPWTPPAFTPPTTGLLALSPDNAGQAAELAVLGNGHPVDVAWSPDGALLAVAVTDRVDVYNTTTWKLAAQYSLPAHQVAFSPATGQLVVAAYATIRWLDLTTGTVVREHTFDLTYVNDLVFSPGGMWLAVGGAAPSERGRIEQRVCGYGGCFRRSDVCSGCLWHVF